MAVLPVESISEKDIFINLSKIACLILEENPVAALAMEQLPMLKGCQAHVSVMLSNVDKNVYKKLGMNLTTEPVYATKKLYHK